MQRNMGVPRFLTDPRDATDQERSTNLREGLMSGKKKSLLKDQQEGEIYQRLGLCSRLDRLEIMVVGGLEAHSLTLEKSWWVNYATVVILLACPGLCSHSKL